MAAKTRTRRAPPTPIPPPERVALTVPEDAAILVCHTNTVWKLLKARATYRGCVSGTHTRKPLGR